MPRSKPNLREKILDAAVGLLRQHGHRKLSQIQIAKAAGIPQGHLTYYFPKRADLLLAIARRSVQQAAQQVAVIGQENARKLGAEMVGFLVKDRQRTRMLLALLVEAGDDAELRRTMVEGFARTRGLLGQVMDIDPESPDAYVMLATLWGLGIQHMLLDGTRDDSHTENLLRRLREWRKP
jgi:AcrR family transcriptional regulator